MSVAGKKILYIDLDNTLVDFPPAWSDKLEWVQRHFGSDEFRTSDAVTDYLLLREQIHATNVAG